MNQQMTTGVNQQMTTGMQSQATTGINSPPITTGDDRDDNNSEDSAVIIHIGMAFIILLISICA
jgi:hypothetical protein